MAEYAEAEEYRGLHTEDEMDYQSLSIELGTHLGRLWESARKPAQLREGSAKQGGKHQGSILSRNATQCAQSRWMLH